jgi:putative phosphoesterase
MKIAVIADTHGRFPDAVAGEIRHADEIWHLGDFCDLDTLASVRSLGPEFHAVLGNNDWGLDLPMHLMLERGGRTFRLIHIPPAKPGGVDFLLHGHTHVPRDEMAGRTRVLNPGCISRPNRGAPASWAWLEVDEKTGAITWTPRLVTRG